MPAGGRLKTGQVAGTTDRLGGEAKKHNSNERPENNRPARDYLPPTPPARPHSQSHSH